MNISTKSVLWIGAWIVLGVARPAITQAQSKEPASSFEEIQSMGKLKKGQWVHIFDDSGKKLKAKVAEISGNELTVTVQKKLWGSERRVLQESVVKEIRRQDHWWNGMLIGAVAGGTSVFLATRSEARCGCYDVPFYPGQLIVSGTALGGAVGVIVDRMIGNKEKVFVRQGVSSNSRFRISPVVSKGNTGLKVAWSF
jgi:hypothetical protein